MHARRILRSVLCLSLSISNVRDVSRDKISQVPTWRDVDVETNSSSRTGRVTWVGMRMQS
jgi:hypothetical protein